MALTDNLVSYWKLNEPSGNARDNVGSNTGVNSNVTYAAGKINNCAVFDGSSSEFNCGSDSGLNPSGSYTINLWFFSDDATQNEAMFVRDLNSGGIGTDRCYGFLLNSSKLLAEAFSASTAYSATGTTTLSSSTWYMATMRVDTDAEEIEVFLNGSSEGAAVTGPATNFTNTQDTDIGRKPQVSAPKWWDGKLDEVGFWDRALTDAEITELYNSATGLSYPFNDLSVGLISYFKMEESNATRVDSHGPNDLADNNTTPSGTGIIDSGADFELDNTEYLSVVDASQAGLDGQTDMTTSMWIKRESTGGNPRIYSKWQDGSTNSSYDVRIIGTTQITFKTYSGGEISKNFTITALNAGTWYHLVFVKTAGVIETYLDGSSEGTVTGLHTTVNDGSAPFAIGASFNFGLTAVSPFDGLIDEFGLWNRALTSTEVGELYNSGAALAYPFEPAVGPATLKTWNTAATATVKTRNGAAIATIKTANTVT